MRRSVLIAGAAAVAAVGATVAVATTALAGTQPGYEAETASNILSGSARVDACKPCSGESRVGGVGRTGRLTFRGVKADEAGAATVAIAYSSVDQRSAWLQVNRGRTLRLAFPATGSPDTTATLTVRLNLQAGDNTLTFSNPFASAPDFDRLDVGGAGGATPTETVSESPPTAPTGSAPTSRPPVATNAPTESDQFAAQEAEVARLVNVERAKAGCSPLTVDARLTTAARLHSQDMAANDYFSHTSQDGTEFATRITRAGYRWSGAGENIAKGQRTPADVMTSWMNSPGHKANILNCGFKDIGVGVAADPRGTLLWTQDFGSQF